MLKQGTLLDATLVAAQVRRPPITAGAGASSATDPDAAWAQRGPRSHFGYKVHLGVDADTGGAAGGVDPRECRRERGGRRVGERG